MNWFDQSRRTEKDPCSFHLGIIVKENLLLHTDVDRCIVQLNLPWASCSRFRGASFDIYCGRVITSLWQSLVARVSPSGRFACSRPKGFFDGSIGSRLNIDFASQHFSYCIKWSRWHACSMMGADQSSLIVSCRGSFRDGSPSRFRWWIIYFEKQSCWSKKTRRRKWTAGG